MDAGLLPFTDHGREASKPTEQPLILVERFASLH
jgi:hypothetical protein